jgi:hypothetical protein
MRTSDVKIRRPVARRLKRRNPKRGAQRYGLVFIATLCCLWFLIGGLASYTFLLPLPTVR